MNSFVFVEDRLAERFCRAIIEKYNSQLSRRCEIIVRDGHGGITRALKEFSGSVRSVKFAGVYDGDMRGGVEPDVVKHALFLPGALPVEGLLKQAIQAAPSAFNSALARDDISSIEFGLRGTDPHDWYRELSIALGMNEEQLLTTFFQIWIRDEHTQEACIGMISDLTKVLERAD